MSTEIDMQAVAMGTKVFHLVKWDGPGPVPDDAKDHPEKYPQISEVVRSGDNIPTEVIYRRSP